MIIVPRNPPERRVDMRWPRQGKLARNRPVRRERRVGSAPITMAGDVEGHFNLGQGALVGVGRGLPDRRSWRRGDWEASRGRRS